MKYFLTLLVSLFIIADSTKAQSDDLPESIVSTGFGFGTSYGIFGSRTIVGYKNSGFLLGLGYVPGGVLGYAVGGQISANWFYANISYCVYGFEQPVNRPANTLTAGNIMAGGMINLNSNKTTFLDLALGHTFAAEESTLGLNGESNNGFNIGIGLMFRIGG